MFFSSLLSISGPCCLGHRPVRAESTHLGQAALRTCTGEKGDGAQIVGTRVLFQPLANYLPNKQRNKLHCLS